MGIGELLKNDPFIHIFGPAYFVFTVGNCFSQEISGAVVKEQGL